MMTEESRQIEELEQFIIEKNGPIENLQSRSGQSNFEMHPADKPDTGEAITGVLVITSQFIGEKWGELFALDATECEQLGKAYGALWDKYYPDTNIELSPELTALGVTAMVVVPRYFAYQKIKNLPSAKGEVSNDDQSDDDLNGFGNIPQKGGENVH